MLYIARQPILDRTRDLHAYELLFRDSLENRFNGTNPELASKKTIDTAVLLGLETLSEGHRVFLNCTHDLIVEEFPTLFPADLTVVEVLESAQATAPLIAACKRLKRSGYRLALDDFVPQDGYEPLIELADIIKVDFRLTPKDVCERFAAEYKTRGRQLLAEKIETEEEFQHAVDSGYTLFQGYLFSRPSILSTATVASLDANQVRILRILSKPHLDFVEAEETIKSDPALCYRLLRFLNSPAFYLQSEIRSILHALTLLGEQEARKWLLLASAVVGLRTRNPHLLTTMLVRARFAELLGPEFRLSSPSLFLLGLLSLMDAVLNITKADLAEQVAVSSDIKAVLKGESNPFGQCLDLVIAFESAEWTRCEVLRRQWHLPPDTLSRLYLEAVQWAKRASDD